MAFRIYLSPPHVSQSELQALTAAFNSGWVAPVGPHLKEFEQGLSSYTGSPYVVALSSGTAALHLALIDAGVGGGDVVLCSTLTFAASANVIKYVGADPVFIDAEAQTWNIDTGLLQEAIIDLQQQGTPAKALIVTHLFGMPADMEAIAALCTEHDVVLIEDAAESLGATINSRHAGTFGKYAALSFNGNKIITTSGGGALLTSNAQSAAHVNKLATQARDNAPWYQHSQVGYNYRLSNLLAAMGNAQLQQIESRVMARRLTFERYLNAFQGLEGVGYQQEPAGVQANRWLSTFTFNTAVYGNEVIPGLLAALAKKGIEARHIWKPMHAQPVFNGCRSYTNGTADSLFTAGICLPSGSNLQPEEQEEVAGIIKKVLAAIV